MVASRKTTVPHIEWLDFKGDGMFTECAIMKRDRLDNTFFIRLDSMDKIDKDRLIKILRNRNAVNMELWDLMSGLTLNNGVNALTYFHQLVKVISAEGMIYSPHAGRIGGGRVDTKTADERNSHEANVQMAVKAASEAAAKAAAQAVGDAQRAAASPAPKAPKK